MAEALTFRVPHVEGPIRFSWNVQGPCEDGFVVDIVASVCGNSAQKVRAVVSADSIYAKKSVSASFEECATAFAQAMDGAISLYFDVEFDAHEINFGRLRRCARLEKLGLRIHSALHVDSLVANLPHLKSLRNLSLKGHLLREIDFPRIAHALLQAGTLETLEINGGNFRSEEDAVVFGGTLARLDTLTRANIDMWYADSHWPFAVAALMRSESLRSMRVRCGLDNVAASERVAEALRASSIRQLELIDYDLHYLPILRALANHPTLERLAMDHPCRSIPVRLAAFRAMLADNSALLCVTCSPNTRVRLDKLFSSICERNINNQLQRDKLLTDLLVGQPPARCFRKTRQQ